jgi:hypothetical protein
VWRKFCRSNAKHCNKQHRLKQSAHSDSDTDTNTAAKDVVKTVPVSRRSGSSGVNR